jgi:hypothetical protein
MKEHYLKTVQPFFDDVKYGRKPFEVRFNDRNYEVGDILHLQEFVPPETYTGQEIVKEVTYILDDPAYCKDGYVIIGFPDEKRIPKEPKIGIAAIWCPVCETIVGTLGGHTKQYYCDECGQAIKWPGGME